MLSTRHKKPAVVLFLKLHFNFSNKPVLNNIFGYHPIVFLAASATNTGQKMCVFLWIQSHFLEVESHGNQHLQQGEFLLGAPVNQGRTSRVALWPLAGVHEVKRATSGRGPIVTGRLQAPVPAIKGPGQRDASNLETEPVAMRKRKGGGKIRDYL